MLDLKGREASRKIRGRIPSQAMPQLHMRLQLRAVMWAPTFGARELEHIVAALLAMHMQPLERIPGFQAPTAPLAASSLPLPGRDLLHSSDCETLRALARAVTAVKTPAWAFRFRSFAGRRRCVISGDIHRQKIFHCRAIAGLVRQQNFILEVWTAGQIRLHRQSARPWTHSIEMRAASPLDGVRVDLDHAAHNICFCSGCHATRVLGRSSNPL